MNKEQLLAQTLYKTQYGSRLYGTNGPKSDTDWKFVFLPKFNDLLLGKSVMKGKFTSPNLEDKTLQVDEDFVSLQKFALDFLNGVPAAVETAFSASSTHAEQEFLHVNFQAFVSELTSKFTNKKLSGMLGFFDHQLKTAQKDVDAGKALDHKEVYHGMRVGYQLVDLFVNGKLTYPLKPHVCEELLKYKNGEFSDQKSLEALVYMNRQLENGKMWKVLKEHTPQLEAEFDMWLAGWLRVFYNLPPH